MGCANSTPKVVCPRPASACRETRETTAITRLGERSLGKKPLFRKTSPSAAHMSGGISGGNDGVLADLRDADSPTNAASSTSTQPTTRRLVFGSPDQQSAPVAHSPPTGTEVIRDGETDDGLESEHRLNRHGQVPTPHRRHHHQEKHHGGGHPGFIGEYLREQRRKKLMRKHVPAARRRGEGSSAGGSGEHDMENGDDDDSSSSSSEDEGGSDSGSVPTLEEVVAGAGGTSGSLGRAGGGGFAGALPMPRALKERVKRGPKYVVGLDLDSGAKGVGAFFMQRVKILSGTFANMHASGFDLSFYRKREQRESQRRVRAKSKLGAMLQAVRDSPQVSPRTKDKYRRGLLRTRVVEAPSTPATTGSASESVRILSVPTEEDMLLNPLRLLGASRVHFDLLREAKGLLPYGLDMVVRKEGQGQVHGHGHGRGQAEPPRLLAEDEFDSILASPDLVSAASVVVQLEGESFSPGEILSESLRSMRKDAEKFLRKKVRDAVVVVPCSLNVSQRSVLRWTSRKAGLKIARVVTGSVSAAVNYCHKVVGQSADQKVMMVYSHGPSALSVSVVRVQTGMVEVLSQRGSAALGSTSVFVRMVRLLQTRIKEKFGEDAIWSLGKDGYAKLRAAVTQILAIRGASGIDSGASPPATSSSASAGVCKEIHAGDISKSSKPVRVVIESVLADGSDFSTVISPEDIKRICEPLLAGAKEVMSDAMKGACDKSAFLQGRLSSADEINLVVLVGSFTKQPTIQGLVSGFFEKRLPLTIMDDCSNTYGAVLLGAGSSGDVPMELSDSLSHAIGILTSTGAFIEVFHRDAMFPARARVSFRMNSPKNIEKPGVTIQFYEMDSIAAGIHDCMRVYNFNLPEWETPPKVLVLDVTVKITQERSFELRVLAHETRVRRGRSDTVVAKLTRVRNRGEDVPLFQCPDELLVEDPGGE